MAKPPIDLDLGCSAILPGQQVATVVAHLLPELVKQSQHEVLINQMGHPFPTIHMNLST